MNRSGKPCVAWLSWCKRHDNLLGFAAKQKKASQQHHIFHVTAGTYNHINGKKQLLQYVLMVVPPRTCCVAALWHCSVALRLVKFLSDRTVCVELMVLDRLSFMCLLSSVQKILPRMHEVWHTTLVSDPTSMYWSLGTTRQVLSCRPAGNNNAHWSSLICFLVGLCGKYAAGFKKQTNNWTKQPDPWEEVVLVRSQMNSVAVCLSMWPFSARLSKTASATSCALLWRQTPGWTMNHESLDQCSIVCCIWPLGLLLSFFLCLCSRLLLPDASEQTTALTWFAVLHFGHFSNSSTDSDQNKQTTGMKMPVV